MSTLRNRCVCAGLCLLSLGAFAGEQPASASLVADPSCDPAEMTGRVTAQAGAVNVACRGVARADHVAAPLAEALSRAPARAPAATVEPPSPDAAADAADPPALEEVVVTAHPLSGQGLSEAVVVLDGATLERDLGTSLGATVARQPGIHSASFGQAVGRPVIHGMSGPRVRVMEDRIDSMDVSVTSGDHATTVEPYIAEGVDVIKGPSALLYGSGAIGGVVNVRTGRIPQKARENIAARLQLRRADNGSGNVAAVRLDGGGAFGWHLDGFTRDAGDYDIPGFAESLYARTEEEHQDEHEDEHEGEGEDDHHEDEHEDEDEHHEEEEAFGILPGSHTNGRGFALGVSRIGARGFAGVAFSQLRYRYGLPGHSHDHHHEEEQGEHEEEDDHHDEDEEHEEEAEGNATLVLDQTRLDMEATLEDPLPGFGFLNVRVGRNDYSHLEIEPSSEVGTRFDNRALEGRVELVSDGSRGRRNVFGLQFDRRDFSAIGEEAFVPPVETTNVGAFWAGERQVGRVELETGLRAERVQHTPTRNAEKRFTVFSAALGVVAAREALSFGIHGGYSSRAPSSEELYADGPHLATGSFEIGNTDLDAEKALHGAATLAWQGERATITATAYLAAWRDHIYQFATGAMEDDLVVLRVGQENAFYRGVDLEARCTVAQFAGGSLSLSALFDTVAATIDVPGNDQLPRLPPRRVGVGMHLERGAVTADVDYLRMSAQDDVTDFEQPTNGYEDLRLHVAVERAVGAAMLRVFLQGRNLTDDEQRHHTSIIKEVAPAPGRTLEVGLTVAF